MHYHESTVENRADVGIITQDSIFGEMLRTILTQEGVISQQKGFSEILGEGLRGSQRFLEGLQKPGLILVELTYPLQESFRFARGLSEMAQLCGSKVVVIGGMDNVVESVFRGSNVELFPMPFDIDDLYILVGNKLGKKMGD